MSYQNINQFVYKKWYFTPIYNSFDISLASDELDYNHEVIFSPYVIGANDGNLLPIDFDLDNSATTQNLTLTFGNYNFDNILVSSNYYNGQNLDLTLFTSSTICDIGLTGTDNGLVTGMTGQSITITNGLDTSNTFDRYHFDRRLKLIQVTGYTSPPNNRFSGLTSQTIYEVVSYTGASEGVYHELYGGFYQGFYKLFGYDYDIFPERMNKGWSVEMLLKPRLTDFFLKSPNQTTLNELYPENKNIFFFFGTRAEDKYYHYADGHPLSDTGYTRVTESLVDCLKTCACSDTGVTNSTCIEVYPKSSTTIVHNVDCQCDCNNTTTIITEEKNTLYDGMSNALALKLCGDPSNPKIGVRVFKFTGDCETTGSTPNTGITYTTGYTITDYCSDEGIYDFCSGTTLYTTKKCFPIYVDSVSFADMYYYNPNTNTTEYYFTPITPGGIFCKSDTHLWIYNGFSIDEYSILLPTPTYIRSIDTSTNNFDIYGMYPWTSSTQLMILQGSLSTPQNEVQIIDITTNTATLNNTLFTLRPNRIFLTNNLYRNVASGITYIMTQSSSFGSEQYEAYYDNGTLYATGQTGNIIAGSCVIDNKLYGINSSGNFSSVTYSSGTLIFSSSSLNIGNFIFGVAQSSGEICTSTSISSEFLQNEHWFQIDAVWERYSWLDTCDLYYRGGLGLISQFVYLDSIGNNSVYLIEPPITSSGEDGEQIEIVNLNERWLTEKDYRKGRLKIYVNGRLFFVIEDFEEIIPRALNAYKERQIGVPFNISWGGGTQGLHENLIFSACPTGYTNYYIQDPENLPNNLLSGTTLSGLSTNIFIEPNFSGTFDGAISQFRMYTRPLDASEVFHNSQVMRNKFLMFDYDCKNCE